MIGVIVFGTGLIVFLVTVSIGLALTLTGFASTKKKNTYRNPTRVWIVATLSTIIVLAVVLSLTTQVSSDGVPSTERYEEMTKAIALWALVPGSALSVGGIALFTLRSIRKE